MKDIKYYLNKSDKTNNDYFFQTIIMILKKLKIINLKNYIIIKLNLIIIFIIINFFFIY